MVLTIEPGLYISPDDESVEEKNIEGLASALKMIFWLQTLDR